MVVFQINCLSFNLTELEETDDKKKIIFTATKQLITMTQYFPTQNQQAAAGFKQMSAATKSEKQNTLLNRTNKQTNVRTTSKQTECHKNQYKIKLKKKAIHLTNLQKYLDFFFSFCQQTQTFFFFFLFCLI